MSEKQHWNGQATETLMLLWGKDIMEKHTKQLKMDQTVFERISEILLELGYNFSWRQCHTKLKNIIQTYRRVKKSAVVEGREPDCLFYRELEYVFNPSEVPMPPLFQKFEDQDGLEAAKEHVVLVSPISTSSSDRSSAPPRPPTVSNSGSNIVRQIPMLFSLPSSSTNSEVPLMLPTVVSNTERSSEQVSPVLPTVSIVTRASEQSARQAGIEVELVEEVPTVASSSSEDREQPGLAEGFSRKRRPKDGDLFELMVLLQEEAEDREDARQQRLLEHESRMEETRQRWEEQRRKGELQIQQQWEEQRRERDFQQMQHVTQMFLQGLQRLSQKEPVEEP